MKKSLRGSRPGFVAVLAAFFMSALLAVVAFAMDFGYIVHARTELQRTADCCALAAASELPDEAAAQFAAKDYARKNLATTGRELSPSDIEFGEWDLDTATFVTPDPDGRPNAVRVTLRRTEASGDPLRLFFGNLVGKSTADVVTSAIATYDHSLCGPFIGIDWLDVPGTPRTDSFDSTKAPYNPASAGDRGSICSDGPITVPGNPTVRGDARAGKGYDVTIEGSAVVTGSIGSRRTPLDLPLVDASEAAITNDNADIPLIPQGNSWVSAVDADGNFLLDGNKTMDLPAGTYYFRDFTMAGQSTLNITGKTTIYVTGNLSRAGGASLNNNTQVAGNLKFLMTGGTANITSENNFYGVVYAPNTSVIVDGSADYFGAIVGKNLTVTGSGTVHYDESLDLEDIDVPRRTWLVD